MAQAEIYKLLEIARRPLAVKEMQFILNENQSKILKDINKMLKYNEVDYIEIDKDKALKEYGCKHKMRLYIIKLEVNEDGTC